MPATITVNGHTFASTTEPVPTCITGFYKIRKRGIYLFDLQMQPMAVVNQELVLGVATRQEDGKVRYGYLPSNHPLYSASMLRQREQLEALAKGQDRNGYFFK